MNSIVRAGALRSGSSGNAIVVQQDDDVLLVDIGINGKTLVSALADIDVRPEQLRGILITHDHSDHTSGLGVCLRRHRVPVYLTQKTFDAILPRLGSFDADLIHLIEVGEVFAVAFRLRA